MFISEAVLALGQRRLDETGRLLLYSERCGELVLVLAEGARLTKRPIYKGQAVAPFRAAEIAGLQDMPVMQLRRLVAERLAHPQLDTESPGPAPVADDVQSTPEELEEFRETFAGETLPDDDELPPPPPSLPAVPTVPRNEVMLTGPALAMEIVDLFNGSFCDDDA